MLILVEDNLLHVDSSTDILEHYGVKGMKWGKRLRSAVESVKQAPKISIITMLRILSIPTEKRGFLKRK